MPEFGASEKTVGLHYNGFRNAFVEGLELVRNFRFKIAENSLELRKTG